MRTLKELRADVYNLIPSVAGTIYRNAELDRTINRAYEKLVMRGQLLKEKMITTVISDQTAYDLTSSTIWLQSSLTDSGETTSAAYSATEVTFTVSSSTGFSVNQLIKIDSEVLRITAAGGGRLTVVRGEAGTTAAAHVITSAIYIGAQPAIQMIYRIDYDTLKQDPIAQNEIDDLSESFGASWYLDGKYLYMSPRTETLKEIKVYYIPFPTSLSADSSTAELNMRDYEDGLVYYAAYERAEKIVAQLIAKNNPDKDVIAAYSGLHTLYKQKWEAVLEECEEGGFQNVGVDFIKPNFVSF